VVRSVGTSGKRASSWLNKIHSPAWVFFRLCQLGFGRCLPLRIAPEIPVRRAIETDLVPLTKITHRRALDHNAGYAIYLHR